jgi:predicted transcriptional regulator of viral defense system
MHNQQLERIRSHIKIPQKRKSQKKESLYIDFLIIRNTAMENMCKAYYSVIMHFNLIDVGLYGVTNYGLNSIANTR